MERQEIPIRFADLRRLATAVPAYLAERAGETAVPSLRAGYEFGLAGEDTVEMITGFSKTYRVELAAFDFTGLISPEPGVELWDTIWFFPLATYLLVCWLLKATVGVLCWPFDNVVATRIWHWQLPTFWRVTDAQSQPPALTVGDFVASAAVGQFVRREQVYFRLVR